MRKSDLESLIDLMGGPQPPSEDDAPKFQSLLRPVNEEAGMAPSLAGADAGREDGEDRWFDGAATPKLPLEGRIRIEAPKPMPLSGDIKAGPPTDEPAPEDGRSIADEGLPALMKIVGKGDGKTEEDRATLARLGDQLFRLSKSDPDAFERFDPKLREFAAIFGRNWEYRQNRFVNLPSGDVKYHAPDKVEVSRKAWDGAMREAAVSAADEVLVAPAKRKALLKGGADTLANLADGVNIFVRSEDVKATIERYRELVETHLGRLDEYKDLKSLDQAEFIGGEIAEWALPAAVGKLVKGIGWASGWAAKKTAAALKKLPPKQRAAAQKAEAIIDKLKRTPLVEELSQTPAVGKLAEGVRKAAKAAPEAAETGTRAMIAGGEADHDLRKAGVRDDRAAVGGLAVGVTDAAISVGAKELAKRFLPKSVQDTPVSEVLEWAGSKGASSAASKGIKRGVTALDRWLRERPRSTLEPVEELRRLMMEN